MKGNTRLSIEHRTTSGGNFADDPPEVWKSLGEEWFTFVPLSGRDFEQGQQMNTIVSHKAECVWRDGVTLKYLTTKLRLTGAGRVFNVASVVNRAEGNRFLDWLLTEVTA